ncbi:uncharacterized protein LOC143558884, partial [Bidens hawaiensis]|uniref:uncharacterized protein LOC143558884 n=1 Tax=Bidens hawaiensis TaxID=980011 RepID=UPI004049D243
MISSVAEVRVGRVHKGRGRGRETGGQDRDDEDQDGCENRGGQDRGSSHKGQRITNDLQRGRKDRSQVQCYRCDEFGHSASMCPERDQKIVLLNEDGVFPKCFETELMEKDVWYLDNGASNNVTGNKAYFYELNEQETGMVKFGDESCIDIRGKGSVLIEGKRREQRLLTDVYHILSQQCNIISLGQATE